MQRQDDAGGASLPRQLYSILIPMKQDLLEAFDVAAANLSDADRCVGALLRKIRGAPRGPLLAD